MGTRRPLAQIITVTLIVLSAVCCLCGGLLTLVTIAPLPGDAITLPNGETAPPEFVTVTIVIVLCLFGVLAFTILLGGLAIWYLFGREQAQPHVWARATAVFLLVGSVFCSLWGALVALTGILSGGMMVTGEQIGVFPSVMLSLSCCVPAVILACASLAIWLIFVRGKQSSGLASVAQPGASPVAAYLDFIQDILRQGGLEESGVAVSIRARTSLALNAATVAEKAQVITFLYNVDLIRGANPLIALSGANLSQIDLRDANLAGINLMGVNLNHAYLHKTNLADAYLRGVNFYYADLRFTDLTGADLERANLQEAKLHGACLRQANLQQADFTQANCWRADFTGANVTNEQLMAAKTMKEAVQPDGTKA